LGRRGNEAFPLCENAPSGITRAKAQRGKAPTKTRKLQITNFNHEDRSRNKDFPPLGWAFSFVLFDLVVKNSRMGILLKMKNSFT
jgi:hypothetical protein